MFPQLTGGNSATNAAESEALSLEEATIFENARQAASSLKKTLEMWLAIGASVVTARKIAERRGGRKTFMRIIEQQGLGRIVNKSTASRLERIMDPENLPRILAWHQTLTERQQIDWAAPTTIFKRCPFFAKPKKPQSEKPLSRAAQLEQSVVALQEENDKLKRRSDENNFCSTDSAENIADTMVRTMSADKINDIFKRIKVKLKQRKAKPEAA